MTASPPCSGTAPSCLAPITPSPIPVTARATRAEKDSLEAALAALAYLLTRNLSRITSCSRKKELERQGHLLDATFQMLLVQATTPDTNPVQAIRAALQSQQLFLQLGQVVDRHDKKIRRNELIRNKRRKKHGTALDT